MIELTITMSPENIARLARGEAVEYRGVVHPDMTVVVRPQRPPAPVPAQPPPRARPAAATAQPPYVPPEWMRGNSDDD